VSKGQLAKGSAHTFTVFDDSLVSGTSGIALTWFLPIDNVYYIQEHSNQSPEINLVLFFFLAQSLPTVPKLRY